MSAPFIPGMSARTSTSFICRSCLRALRTPRKASPMILQRNATYAAYNITSHSASSRSTLNRYTTTHVRHIAPRSILSPVHSRLYSSTGNALPTQIAERGIAPLPQRRLISLSGPDAPKFLQGLITNNVDPDSSDSFYSGFLDARGRVLWDVFVWRLPPQEAGWSCYIELDAGEVDACMRHLKKHKLRSKIKIETVSEDSMGTWSYWGAQGVKLPQNLITASLTDPRVPEFGTRILMKDQGAPNIENLPVVDTEQYHLRRYLYGIPEGQREIQRESALPMECNIDLSEGIDFRKGCYVGQELTIRTKHTGVVRKRILPIQLYHPDAPAPPDNGIPEYDPSWKGEVAVGTDIKQLAEEGSIKKGRATGKFISSIGNVGLAMCRLEMMTPMRVSAEGGTYKPGAEFGLQVSDEGGEKPMRIKAFVPQWLKEREQEVWAKGRQRQVQ